MSLATIPVARYRVPSGRQQLVVHVLLILALAAAWQSLVDAGVLKAIIFGRPTGVFRYLVRLLTDLATARALAFTMSEVVAGLGLGAVAGIALGIVLTRVRALRGSIDPVVLGLYTLPRIALIPLFIVWFGLGMPSKIAAVFLHGFVIFLLGTYATIDSVDRVLVSNLWMLGASRWEIVRHVYLPWAWTHLFTSFRQALGLGIGTAVVAELIGSFEGVGYEIGLRLGAFDMNGTFAWVLIVASLAVVLDRIATQFERRLLRWR